MKDLFSAYYYHPLEQVTELWNKENTLFVIDTNILLNLYLAQEQTRTDILSAIRELDNRVWIPYQVALEYQKNRIDKIAESRKSYKKLANQLDTILQPPIQEKFFKQILGDSQYHSLFKYNPNFKSLFNDKYKEILNIFEQNRPNLNKVISEIKDQLNQLTKVYPQVNGDDPIRNELDIIFHNKVGAPFKTQDELDEIFTQGEERYMQQIPPGFKDSDKTDTYFDNGLKYKAKFGDLLIFNQICNYATDNSIKNIILITEDNKEDWHEIYEFEGEKYLGARKEIKQEAKNTANIDNFIILDTEKFLRLQAKNNSVQIHKESIKEVKEIVKKKITEDKFTLKIEMNSNESAIEEKIHNALRKKAKLEQSYIHSKKEINEIQKQLYEIKNEYALRNDDSSSEIYPKITDFEISLSQLEGLCTHTQNELQKIDSEIEHLNHQRAKMNANEYLERLRSLLKK